MPSKYLDYIKLIDIGEEVYALINPLNDYNLYIPVRCKIIDLDITEKKGRYIIKILEFLEDFEFVKENFINKNWIYARRSSTKDNKIEERKSPNKLRYYKDLNSLEDIYSILNGTDKTEILSFDNKQRETDWQDYEERHYIYADIVNVFEDKEHMLSVFNDITEFVIILKLRSLKTYVMRKNYTGNFKIDTEEKFNSILQKFTKNKKVLDTI